MTTPQSRIANSTEAVREHMPFSRHRTCAQWDAPPERGRTANRARNYLIAGLYLQGQSGQEIADQLGISKTAIYDALAVVQVPRRPKGRAPIQSSMTSPGCAEPPSGFDSPSPEGGS